VESKEPLYKTVSEYIKENIMGCRFVGTCADGELLVAFDHEDDDLILAAARKIRQKFSEVTKVTVVEQLDVKKATELINALNKELGEDATRPRGLLDIGTF
jgi:hypothetical protein